jgi:phage shock protein PspC (stress-responsive transcriptional regulator)
MNDTPTPDETAGGSPAGGTTPGYQPYSGQHPKATGMDGFFDGIRRTGIVRSEERWIGGVGGGLARRMNIDPLIVRGLFGVSVLLGGLGLVLYGVGWLLLPEERDGRIHFQQLTRGDFDAAVIGGFGLMLVGFAFPDRLAPFMWWAGDSGWWRGIVGLVAVAVIIAVIASAAAKGRTAPTTSLPPQGGHFPAPPTGAPHTPTTAPTAAAAPRRPEGPTMYPAPPATPPYAPPVYAGTAGGPRPPYGPPVIPPRPARKGPGAAAVGVVFALSLLVLAALLYAERVGSFDGPVLLTAGAVAVILCGLGIVAAGLQGRSSGGLGALAIISVIVLAPLSAIDWAGWDVNGVAVGEVRDTPTTVDAAENGYSLVAGEVNIDLTEVPLAGDAIEVPIHVGTGEVTVTVPEDGAYTAQIRVIAGEIHWPDQGSTNRVGATWEEFESEAVQDGTGPDLALRISVGAGTVTVLEASR